MYESSGLLGGGGGPADILTRFFFVHESGAQAAVSESRSTYEFLHAPFGKYLIAWLVDQLVRSGADSLRRSEEDPVGGASDGGKGVVVAHLVGYACLAHREQILTLLRGVLARRHASDWI